MGGIRFDKEIDRGKRHSRKIIVEEKEFEVGVYERDIPASQLTSWMEQLDEDINEFLNTKSFKGVAEEYVFPIPSICDSLTVTIKRLKMRAENAMDKGITF